MEKQGAGIKIIPLVIGAVFLFFIAYIIQRYIPSEFLLVSFGIIFIVICMVIAACIKNIQFREKVFYYTRKILEVISDFGVALLRDDEKSRKKKRVPISAKTKNKIYDIAGGKCQECGKKGNLKIHHIDGNPSNNQVHNLVLLCGNHHDDADKGVIPKWRLKNIRQKQATPDHTSYRK
ncbi:hypothetical protein GF406_12075 [candidate division KSB1 bacterium]|nr:hypothetical protein [candidate division KSB1 bacterium]